MLQTLGWVATAVFSASYFFRSAACLWIAYGVTIRAWPVVAANVIVAAAELCSSAGALKSRETAC